MQPQPQEIASKIIPLTTDNSSWIETNYIPKNLIDYSINNFNELFLLHPKVKHKIIYKNNNVDTIVYRYSQTYLNTPKYDPNDAYFKTHNYMYSGLDFSNNNNNVPDLFSPFYHYIKNKNSNYNQIIMNWYETKNDYIAFHRDCLRQLNKDYPIIIITLSETPYRNFEIIPYENNPDTVSSIYSNLKILSENGLELKFCGNSLIEFRHGIPEITDPFINVGRRISISFRVVNTPTS